MEPNKNYQSCAIDNTFLQTCKINTLLQPDDKSQIKNEKINQENFKQVINEKIKLIPGIFYWGIDDNNDCVNSLNEEKKIIAKIDDQQYFELYGIKIINK